MEGLNYNNLVNYKLINKGVLKVLPTNNIEARPTV